MSFKLRLLLFYLNYFAKDNLSTPPDQIRISDQKELPKYLRIVENAPESLFEVRDQKIKVRDDQEITLRIYRPNDGQNLPLIIYYHGGGFVLRSLDSHDYVCRRISKMNNAVVVSVDYRLAPENKFPIPHQDCYDATVWAVENSDFLNISRQEVTVMGDSAGANLASVVSILARDNNGPEIKNQVLIYPCCDSSKKYESEKNYAKGYFLTTERMDWFTDHYIREEQDVFNPLVSPVLTEDLSDLPRAFVFTAEYDPLKDEGHAYAQRLEEAGNEVLYKEYPNVIHGFFNMPKISKECGMANQDIRTFLQYS